MDNDKDTMIAPRRGCGFAWMQASTAYYHDGRLQRLAADTGVGNLLFLDLLTREAYARGGYYLDWRDGGSDKAEVVQLAVSILGVSAGVIDNDWLPYLLRHGFFDRGLYRREGVLSSREIQERYVKMCRYWKRRLRIDLRLRLLPDDGDADTLSGDRKPHGGKLLTKVSADLLPESAETEVMSAENSAETEKNSAEMLPNSAEMKKNSAEFEIISAETEKNSAETEKISAEMKKTSAELQTRATVGIYDNNVNNNNNLSYPLPPKGGVTVEVLRGEIAPGTERREALLRMYMRRSPDRASVTDKAELDGLIEEFVETQTVEQKVYRDAPDAVRHLNSWLRLKLERRLASEQAAEALEKKVLTPITTVNDERERRRPLSFGGGGGKEGSRRRNSPEEMRRRAEDFCRDIVRELEDGDEGSAPAPWD